MIDFNINDNVYVKLTILGHDYLRQRHYGFWEDLHAQNPLVRVPDYSPPKEDDEGWSRWQLWTLIEAFGEGLRMGGPLLFDTNIRIETNET